MHSLFSASQILGRGSRGSGNILEFGQGDRSQVFVLVEKAKGQGTSAEISSREETQTMRGRLVQGLGGKFLV